MDNAGYDFGHNVSGNRRYKFRGSVAKIILLPF